jgi:broad specificity phosphatase PhoE
MTVQRVVFIRPGETDWNKLERWQGHVIVPLNSTGRAQAERLAQFIRPIGLTSIYSSDLRRARDTAEILCALSDLTPIYDARLRERSMGEWQGLTLREIVEWEPQQYARLIADPDGYQVPLGESRRQVALRARAAFDEIILQGGETIGVITHTTAMRSLIAGLVPGSNPYHMQFKNMSVTTIVRQQDGNWQISQLDDVTHLEGMPTQSFIELEENK